MFCFCVDHRCDQFLCPCRMSISISEFVSTDVLMDCDGWTLRIRVPCVRDVIIEDRIEVFPAIYLEAD